MSEPSSKLPNLTTETEEFITKTEEQSAAPLYKLSPVEARNYLLTIQENYNSALPKIPVQIQDKKIELNNANTVEIRIVRPENTDEILPAILYIHGGGWIMGDKNTHDTLVRKLCVCTNTTIVFPSYSLSPEEQYPTALNQIYSTLQYIQENAAELKINPDKIAISGDSAGGNMAAAVCIMAKKEKTPLPVIQALFYPVTNADMDTKSYELFKDGPWLTKKAMEWFWDAYAPDKKERESIFISPLKAALEDLQGLPPALIITDENDVLRDEGEAYARKLEQANVKVISVRINGTIHDFMMLNALADTEPAKGAFTLACNVLKNILH